ncbi:MAG: ATP-binding protein [Luteimonas sp.]
MLRTLLVLAVLVCAPWRAVAGVAEFPQFRRYGFEQGLPKGTNHIGVDRQGFVWIATSDGLARYDGVQFKLWRREQGAADALPEDYVEAVFIDPKDRVWVATPNALSVMEADRRGFRHIRFSGRAATCGTGITDVANARDGGMWIANAGGDLCHVDRNERIERHATLAGDGISIISLRVDARGRLLLGTSDGLMAFQDGAVRRIADAAFRGTRVTGLNPDADGALWVGSGKGLHRLLADDRVVPAPWSLPAAATHAQVLRDRRGGYWIGTMHGLYRAKDGVLSLVEHAAGEAALSSATGILYMQEDNEGGLWLVTYSQGLMYLPPDWHRFATITSFGTQALEGMDLRDVSADASGHFWVATATDLYRLDRTGRRLRQVLGNAALGLQWINALRARADGTLWIAHSQGVALFDPVTMRIRPWLGAAEGVAGANEVVEAPDGSLWVDIPGSGTRGFTRAARPLPGSYIEDRQWDRINRLQVDKTGAIWRARKQALLRWDGKRFMAFPLVPGPPVDAFTFAANHRVWVSRFGALEAYVWDGKSLALRERITPDTGLPTASVRGMLISPRGQVWLTTLRGLVLYSPGQRRIRMFAVHDGLREPDFSVAAPTLGADGFALAVSTGGLVVFDSDLALPRARQPKLAIESLQVMRDEDAVPFDPARPVRLLPRDRDLRVNARLLSFADARSHRYRFKLDGYDPDWVVQQANGERVFSRLDAGRYRLHVQAAGTDGAWSNAWTVAIMVLPPWWRTPQSLAAFVVLAAGLLWWLAQQYRDRLKRRHAWQLAVQTRDIAEQASHAKTRFLATLGHEVRTPMTGVLGMSELLLGTDLDTRQRGHVEAIRCAGDHLLRLVNDALDLARIEAGKLDLEIASFDLRVLVDEVAVLMAPMAERKGLQFTDAIGAGAPRCVRGDCGRVRQILLNLVGNAIKFTERGEVSVRVMPWQPHGVSVEIVDTGPGLNDEQCARLFQRFEQAQGARTAARYGGSGLGLAISQELAAAMDGCIHVDSTLGKGTCFRVELPLHAADDDDCTALSPGVEPHTHGGTWRLLLVEDDPTVADVIAGLLRQRGHHVVHAAHGLAALIEVGRTRFDAALLDLDLPGMDGLALARQLRAQGFAGPLLAVTARSDAGAETQSRAAGCDGFLRKPVTGSMLVAAIEGSMCREPEARLAAGGR